jgi:hypothetical protein
MLIAIGYTPLFRGEFSIKHIQGDMEIFKQWEKFNSPMPKGVLWTNDKHGLNALLVIDNAKAVYAHLMEWCEGMCQDWFIYQYKQFDECYCITIHPRIDVSINRMKVNANIQYGNKFKEFNSKIYVLYRPLTCVGTSLKTIKSIKNFNKNKLNVGLIDALDVESHNYENASILHGVSYDKTYESHLDDTYKEYIKDNP